MFSDDKFFREELFALSLAAKDNLADFDDILNFAISDDLTVLKLLKVQRLFHFLSSYAAAHLAEILPKNRLIVFQPTQACAVHSPTLSIPAAP
jgi:hypothetical protein